MNRDKLVVVVCLLTMLGIYAYFCPEEFPFWGEKDAHLLLHAIRSKHKPRVVYFFAWWCGTCAMYGPVLKDAASPYSESIDFQSVNVDDPSYHKLISQYEIHSVPATIIFDSHGQPVLAEGGCIDRQTLNDTLSNVYRSTLIESLKKQK